MEIFILITALEMGQPAIAARAYAMAINLAKIDVLLYVNHLITPLTLITVIFGGFEVIREYLIILNNEYNVTRSKLPSLQYNRRGKLDENLNLTFCSKIELLVLKLNRTCAVR